MKRRLAMMLSVLVVLSLVLAACGGSKNEGNGGTDNTAGNGQSNAGGNTEISGEIVFATHRTDLVDNGTYDKYVSEFNKQYPNVKVKCGSYTNYESDIRVHLTAVDA